MLKDPFKRLAMRLCHLLLSVMHALVRENVEDIVVHDRIRRCSLSNGNLDVYIVARHDVDASHLWLFFFLFLWLFLLQSIFVFTPNVLLFTRSDELEKWQPADPGNRVSSSPFTQMTYIHRQLTQKCDQCHHEIAGSGAEAVLPEQQHRERATGHGNWIQAEIGIHGLG